MSEFIQKISSYYLFNYLLSGVVFVVFASKITHYVFTQEDLITSVFVYYFAGLVISRLGSLIIEPFLKWTSFLKFEKYSDFLIASKNDEKIETLSEANNMYRTLSAMAIVLLLLKIYEMAAFRSVWLEHRGPILLVILLLIMFLFSYRKQTEYVSKRIRAGVNKV